MDMLLIFYFISSCLSDSFFYKDSIRQMRRPVDASNFFKARHFLVHVDTGVATEAS